MGIVRYQDRVVEARFSSRLAAVVFGDEPAPGRMALEREAVQRLRNWLKGATAAQIHAACSEIDGLLVAGLSGVYMLEVARDIEERAPEAIASMPKLLGHLSHLSRSSEIAQMLAPRNLAALTRALRDQEE